MFFQKIKKWYIATPYIKIYGDLFGEKLEYIGFYDDLFGEKLGIGIVVIIVVVGVRYDASKKFLLFISKNDHVMYEILYSYWLKNNDSSKKFILFIGKNDHVMYAMHTNTLFLLVEK